MEVSLTFCAVRMPKLLCIKDEEESMAMRHIIGFLLYNTFRKSTYDGPIFSFVIYLSKSIQDRANHFSYRHSTVITRIWVFFSDGVFGQTFSDILSSLSGNEHWFSSKGHAYFGFFFSRLYCAVLSKLAYLIVMHFLK